MNKRTLTSVFLTLFVAAVAFGQDHWVATWAASPQPRVAPPQAPAPQPGAPPPPPAGFNNQTLRMIVRTSVGGRRIRVQLSNAYGSMALMVGAAHVALRAKDSAIVPGSDRTLTFSGKATGMIPPGALLVSDPVDLEAPGLSDLAVSLYVPGDTAASTMHATGLHTTYVSKAGDFTPQAEIADPATTTRSWYWLSSVDVLAPASTGLIVAYGDSITDGATSTPDTDRSWPSALARRLAANPATANLAIVNQGISGNRILRDLAGTNALARFDRDVLSQAGVKWLMFMEGINDIGRGTGPNAQPADAVTADDLIAGMRQIIERAHMHGIKVIGCTLTPFEGAGYQSETGEVMREALNLWIRSSAAFDAVVDFDAATRDTNNPKRFRDGFNITDHLHPNDAGYQAMAEAVDLSIFAPPAPATTQSRGSGRNR